MPDHSAMTFRPLHLAEDIPARCLCLDAAGIDFTTGRVLNPGQGIDIRIRDHHHDVPPLRALAEVSRCRPVAIGFEVRAAVRLLQVETD